VNDRTVMEYAWKQPERSPTVGAIAGGVILLMLGVASTAWGGEAAQPEAMRAALLYNFIKYTEWPFTAGAVRATVGICVAADDRRQIDAIEALDAREAGGKALVSSPPEHELGCGVVYVDSSQQWSELSRVHLAAGTLTVGGYPGFVAEGGMIEISLQESGPRFDINLAETRRAGLRLDAPLLHLAQHLVE